jgi:hypothetical protein
MSNKVDRAKQYFLQAKEAHSSGNGIDLFNSPFTVPAELLFIEMCRIASVGREYKHRKAFRQIFEARLKSLIEDKKDFDENYLGKGIKQAIAKQKRKTYWVYFGVPVKRSSNTPLPFGKTITLEGIVFQSIDQKQFERAHKKDCLDDFYNKFDENLKPREKRTWLLKDLCYFKARVEADDGMAGGNLVLDAFNILHISATVVQNSHSYRHSMFSVETKSRSILAPVGIILVSSDKHSKCDIFWSSDIRTKSEETLTFTNKPQKLDFFKTYLRTCQEDTPISKRLRQFLFEFASALHAQDPHVRQLGLWRCLEIATSKQGTSRTEKDIVQIMGNFYSNSKHWQQQGNLIKDVRNNYVHNGTALERDAWGSVDKYLNWTQEYVDNALGILRWMRMHDIGKKTSDEIDDFFDLYSKPTSTLRMAGKLVRGRAKP